MAGTNFVSRVKHVQAGEPVDAAVTGRATRALEARDNYLREAIAAMENGRLLVLKDQLVDAAVLVGQPVYWNSTSQRFELAQAAVEADAVSGSFTTKASADCLGLVLAKKAGGTTADIAVSGIAYFSSLADAIDGTVTPGRYYLSAAEPGKLVQQKPAVSVAVCFVLGPLDACDENTWVYIQPQMRNFLDDHVHYRFDLVCRPAGTHVPPTPGERHTITAADSTKPGWLPADDASFSGNAPAGAKFGYNLAAHTEISHVWPPVPISAVVVYWDRGIGLGGTEVDTRSRNRLLTVDQYGIWWMSDCYNEVPWPTTYDTGASLSSSAASDACPSAADMRMVLAFLHSVFTAAGTVVTSLRPADSTQPVAFVNSDGETATAGDLYVRLLLSALTETDEYYGGQVLKELVGDLHFGRGWVTEGLIAGANVTLTGTHSRALDPTLAVSATNPLVYQGLVTLDVEVEPASREIDPQIVRLGDAVERLHKQVPYIGFPQNRDSEIRMRFNVPSLGLPSTPYMRIRVMLFGRATGSLPPLVMTYQRIARPDGVTTPTVLAEGDTAVTFASDDVAVTTDQAVEITSAAFAIAAGDTVLVSIVRESGSGYDDAEVGIVRIVGVISAT